MQSELFVVKRCSHCKLIKFLCQFSKNKSTKDGYQRECKKCCGLRNEQWRKNYPKYHKQYNSYYYLDNREKEIQRSSEYRKAHPEHFVGYYQTHRQELKKKSAEYQKLYRRTPEGKQAQRKSDKKRRGLGFNPLNKFFEGSHGHHINNIDVVYIPKEIHLLFVGLDRQEHRKRVLSYYGTYDNMIKNIIPKKILDKVLIV